jgi:hypothetical protein
MKNLRLLALFVVSPLSLFANAPATVSGLVFSEARNSAIVGDRISSTLVVLLRADGQYVGLYSSLRSLRVPLTASIPADGSWSYRKTGDASAELTIGPETYQLTFRSDTAGTIRSPDVFSTTIDFTLTPYDATAQLANCSNRSFIRSGGSAFTGFVITNGMRRVLVRAIGPTLQAFGITETLRKPTLKITRAATNETVASNEGWSASQLTIVNQRAGAFPLPENSLDAALFLSLPPGAYIAEVSSGDPTDSGQVMIEVYALP